MTKDKKTPALGSDTGDFKTKPNNEEKCSTVPPLRAFRVRLAELIHPGDFFNSDASLEIDRLTALLEAYRNAK